MAYRLPWRILVCFAIRLVAVHSEVCHVQPQCDCKRENGGVIRCQSFSAPYFPFLGLSNFRFMWLIISGNRDVTYIRDGTFSGLNVSDLEIQFTGITELNCSDFSGIGEEVSRIYLSNNLLNRVPSCSLARFGSITKLALRNNRITSLRLGDFDHFPRLRSLYLNTNRISSITPATFRKLNELTTLYLWQNNISVLQAGAFDGLTELESLYLDHNNLASLDDNLFRELSNLEYLSIKYNRLSQLSYGTFRYLRRLRSLRLSYNKITRVVPETFLALRNLYQLELQNNSLTEIEPRMFAGLSKVRDMHLGHNKLTGIKTNAFVDCPYIYYLNLSGNALQSLQTGSFRNLSSLRKVDLSGNRLRDIGSGVFVNVSDLQTLSLKDNQISSLSEVLFYVIKSSLQELELQSNGLSSKSWTWLSKLLGHLKGLRMLDLSHNPLKYIPKSVLSILATMGEVRLRNCSLDEVPDNALNISLDLSMNNIQGPLLFMNSNTSATRFDVSNNKITALNIKTLMAFRNVWITCDNNNIEDELIIELTVRNRFYDLFYVKVSAKNNLINKTIQLLFHGKPLGYLWTLVNVDLSSNSYVNVTKLPLDIKYVSDETVWIPCSRSSISRFHVNLLNLSANVISYISPEACLGIVKTLDLRNNRLEVFGKFMPEVDSPEYRLQYLYLSGNRLHRATTEAFDRYKLLYHLDLRDNNIAGLDSFNLSGRFEKLYLTGNPLSCGCEIAGLRNGTVPDKIDLVRCHSPRAFNGYLAVCFPLSACPASVSVSVGDKTKWLCEQDSNIKLSNLKVTVGNGVVSATWTKTGPGMITGYRVEYHPVNNIGMGASALVHPETEKVLLDDLLRDKPYNICVFAVLHSQKKSPAVCTEIGLHVSVHVISARNQTSYADDSVVIGLASALGFCVLLAGAVTICLCVRKRRSGQNQPNDSCLDTEPGNSQSASTNPAYAPTNVSAQAELGEINSVNIRHPNNESQTEDGNIYERINISTAYENTSFGA